jgi:uncharacterized protein (TIGR03086 family)
MNERVADAVAVRYTVELVASITEDDLVRPTPCAGWDLGDLLVHMTVQHHGFAAAAAGRGADPSVWRVPAGARSLGVVRGYRAAADAVLAAFAPADVPDRPFTLPEIARTPFPGRNAIGFHLVDYVVHGWDVARALGADFRPAAEVLAVALPIARAVPGGDARLRQGAAFAPALDVPPAAGPLDELLRLLGRDPDWGLGRWPAPPS